MCEIWSLYAKWKKQGTKAAYCGDSAFIWSDQSVSSTDVEHRSVVVGLQMDGREGVKGKAVWEGLLMCRVFESVKNILELIRGGDCIISWIYSTTELHTIIIITQAIWDMNYISIKTKENVYVYTEVTGGVYLP